MQRLCDEILQLIFCELPDPSSFTLVSQRLYRFSQDPYVRAHYFLVYYGRVEAMFYALGKGKVLDERVLDILLSSGAQLSRYLIQIAIHHYFHTQSHFIKTAWVRSVSLKVFTYFLKIAGERYGEIPHRRGEDDGTTFSNFLKESKLSAQRKTITWEAIRDILETYKFIPFCHRDPLTPQFPLALAIEPRLLPYAVANGFSMDYKYRDFVFRKMFERPASPTETRAEDVASNVRELCKLDPAMFVSRTVAAEVCMEAKANDIGYQALKQLDKSGDLHFEMSNLVEDLLRTFLTTRSICSISTGDVLLHLFTDYPSADVTVRLVILIVVFIAADQLNMTAAAVKAKLEPLGMMPVTRRDVFNILVNPFVEKFQTLREFAKSEVGVNEDDSKGMKLEEVEKLAQDVAVRCTEISCKGNLVKKLCVAFPSIKNAISRAVLSKHQISLEDLPPADDVVNCNTFSAPLSKDFTAWGAGEVHSLESLMPEQHKSEPMDDDDVELSQDDTDLSSEESSPEDQTEHLGEISQETLTTMIRHEEAVPIRSRRRHLFSFNPSDFSGRMRYPHDALPVAKWAKTQYGPRSPVVATFMTHAVLNGNGSILHYYLYVSDHPALINAGVPPGAPVPVTLKHFQLLARLGRAPSYYLWRRVETGAEFYFDENDYFLENTRSDSGPQKIKIETSDSDVTSSSSIILGPSIGSRKSRKRPRRTATKGTPSYVIPGSDDEAIVGDDVETIDAATRKKIEKETNLQLWIKHLTLLAKAEKRNKHLQSQMENDTNIEVALRLYKNEFMKSLNLNLRSLRKIEAENRTHCPSTISFEDAAFEEDEDEFTLRPSKKRKTTTHV
ncbi:hypothetical protein CPB83DRAFT_942409 [Crepidotus variabilis]|uniref:Uncharacterized protein n=1 Tax=Crepidotus variabilis TaxID=179855 RepID=A0A9P6EQJ6_9AGAR|nr:hypothetical protein CPB83DRAFT_942409 [Crepidotus variabilis]